MRALSVFVLAVALGFWAGTASAQQAPPPAPPAVQAPPAGPPDAADEDDDEDMAEPQRATPAPERGRRDRGQRGERGAGVKRQACRDSAQSQGLRGPAMRDHMQVCLLEVRLDCLKQAIAQKVTGRDERRDFVRQCSRS